MGTELVKSGIGLQTKAEKVEANYFVQLLEISTSTLNGVRSLSFILSVLSQLPRHHAHSCISPAFTGLGRTSPSKSWLTAEAAAGNYFNAIGQCIVLVAGGIAHPGYLAGPLPLHVKIVELHARP